MLTMAPKDINRSVLQFEPCQCNLVEVYNCCRTMDCFKIWMNCVLFSPKSKTNNEQWSGVFVWTKSLVLWSPILCHSLLRDHMSPKVAVSSQIILKQDVYQELYQDYVIQHSPPATWEVFKDTGVSNLRDAQVHPSYMTCTHPFYLRFLILPLPPLLTPHDLSHQTESHGSTATPTANKKANCSCGHEVNKNALPIFLLMLIFR